MTYVRLAFYVLYVVFGIIIIVRMLQVGLRGQIIAGVVLGGLLIALGVYRLVLFFRMRSTS